MTKDSLQDHNLFERLELLNSLLEDDKNKKKLDVKDHNFFKTAHDFILGRLKNTLPTLVQKSDLDNSSNEIQNGTNQLSLFFGNTNVGHANNAKNHIYTALNRIRNLPYPILNEDFDFASEIENFQKVIEESNQDLAHQAIEIKSDLVDIESRIRDRKSEVETLQNVIQKKENELEKLSLDFEKRFDEVRTNLIEEFKKDREKFELDANVTKEHLDNKLSEAQRIVNVIGNIGVTGNFQEIANSHRKGANAWRLVALLFMAGFSGLLIWTLIDLGDSEFDWRKSLIRLIAAAALSYPATYAARESTKHRKLENYNRKIELELASIESFIEILDESKKQEIKEKLAEKYFGATFDHLEDADLKRENDFSISSFERILNAVTKLTGKN